MKYTMHKISGRFKGMEKPKLESIRDKYVTVLESWGAKTLDLSEINQGDSLPLWVEVEFLENIIDFELKCNPFLKTELTN